MFFNLFFITFLKGGIHHLALTLTKTNYNNENVFKKMAISLVVLLLVNRPFFILYSQYVEL